MDTNCNPGQKSCQTYQSPGLQDALENIKLRALVRGAERYGYVRVYKFHVDAYPLKDHALPPNRVTPITSPFTVHFLHFFAGI